jgi:hypothetical protein
MNIVRATCRRAILAPTIDSNPNTSRKAFAAAFQRLQCSRGDHFDGRLNANGCFGW